MKFNKQINNGTLLIPGGAFKISGFEGGEKVEIHTLDSAVVVLKKQMTTMELIQAMDALHRLATELTVHLARVCGTCDDCEDGCPFDDLEDGMLELPDYLREEAGVAFRFDVPIGLPHFLVAFLSRRFPMLGSFV